MRDIGVDAIAIRELTKQYASRAGAMTAPTYPVARPRPLALETPMSYVV